jgi:ribose transport system substrate-binding protein
MRLSNTKTGAVISAALTVILGMTVLTEVPATATNLAQVSPPPENAAPPLPVVPGSGKGLVLGYINFGETAGPFITAVANSISKEAKIAGATLEVCDAHAAASDAVACARDFKLEHVQAYLNFQPVSTAAPAVCAAGPKVPVIAIDIHQPPCETAFMGTNNAYAGYLGGVGIGKYVKAHFNCKYDAYVSLEDTAVGPVSNERMGGYRTGFESICGPIHNLTQVFNSGSTDPTLPLFTDILTRLPSAHHIIVVGINDESVEGAIDAARTADRLSDIYVSGQGLDNSAYCLVKTDSHWIGDTAYFPEHYGLVGVPYLIKLAKGETVPKLLYVHDEFVTAANIAQYYNVSNCPAFSS